MAPLFFLRKLKVAPQGRTILHIDELAVPQGVHTAVIGPNGAGKSTLLRALLGRFNARCELFGAPAAPQIRAGKVAWVAQNGRYSLPLTVAEYARLGRIGGGLFRPPPPDHGLLDKLLAEFDLAGLADKRIDTLSGGEQQRANIVRALMQQAPAILLDEPCNHLDIRHQHRLMQFVRRAKGQFNAVMVLHDLNLAAAYAEHIILMQNGRIAAQGSVDEVMQPERLSETYQWPVERLEADGEIFFRMRNAGRD